MEILSLSRLSLTAFRNYASLRLECGSEPVIITGPNGAGKTNILEAISFLAPGKGLRSAALGDMDHCSADGGTQTPWAVATTLETALGSCMIGTGRASGEVGASVSGKRIVKLDGTVLRSHTELAHRTSIVWLTPQMDPLFLAPSQGRRRFLDRLVYHFDAGHATRVNSYEYAKSERARLLKAGRFDPAWLTALEQKMAEMGVAIASSRMETIRYLQETIMSVPGEFPKARLAIEGSLEQAVATLPALQVEEQFRGELAALRQTDARTGRTNSGVHRSDLLVTHAEKNMPAASCSTGEQKALLIAIILAEARARMKWRRSTPVLLLDEVVVHLDKKRREALLADILDMGAQAWITGTDSGPFAMMRQHAQYFHIEEGKVVAMKENDR